MITNLEKARKISGYVSIWLDCAMKEDMPPSLKEAFVGWINYNTLPADEEFFTIMDEAEAATDIKYSSF